MGQQAQEGGRREQGREFQKAAEGGFEAVSRSFSEANRGVGICCRNDELFKGETFDDAIPDLGATDRRKVP